MLISNFVSLLYFIFIFIFIFFYFILSFFIIYICKAVCNTLLQSEDLRESSFNMTRGGGDDDIETRSLKF